MGSAFARGTATQKFHVKGSAVASFTMERFSRSKKNQQTFSKKKEQNCINFIPLQCWSAVGRAPCLMTTGWTPRLFHVFHLLLLCFQKYPTNHHQFSSDNAFLWSISLFQVHVVSMMCMFGIVLPGIVARRPGWGVVRRLREKPTHGGLIAIVARMTRRG